MNTDIFEKTTAAVARLQARHMIGRVSVVGTAQINVAGFTQVCGLGDPVSVETETGAISGEIVKLARDTAQVLLEGPTEGIKLGAPVTLLVRKPFAPDQSWVGRVIDPNGLPLDDMPLVHGTQTRTVQAAPPPAHARRPMGERLETGLAVFNTLLPVVRGQRIGLFAGSGVGKSTLIADLARGTDADVIVIALVGERGREVRHFIDQVLGPEGMKRAIVIAATSDRAAQVRKRCALAAMTVAEHFRDAGQNVMLFIDSVTRFCEAHREIAVAAGESVALRGYPSSTASAIANLCERAGPGCNAMGDITAVLSVLVAGSDMEEPVADMLRGVLDGHVILDREIAERGRFPAVDVLRSVSRSLPDAANYLENNTIAQTRAILGRYANAELMIQAGLYVAGTDPAIDKAIACHGPLDAFLSIKDKRGTDAHFTALRRILGTIA